MAPEDIKALLYTTNVRPILKYACSVWDPHFLNLSSKIERVQNRASRFVTNIYTFPSSVTKLKEQLGWHFLALRRKCFRLKRFRFSYKTHINKDKYIHSPDHNSPRIDHSLKKKCRTKLFKHSFFPKSVHAWNALPELVVTETSDASFSSLLLNL